MSRANLICTTDRELPFKVEDQSVRRDMHGNEVKAMRSPSNHFVLVDSHPVLYSEEDGSRLWRLAKIPKESMSACVDLIKDLLQSKGKSEITEINSQPATECKLSQIFLESGFHPQGQKLVRS